MSATFISYRRDDSGGYAGRLHEELEERLGSHQVFRDVDTLRPGQDFVDAIEHRLRDCQSLIAVIGRGWLNARDDSGARRLDLPDDYVCMEIAAALQRTDVVVVPVLVGGATMPSSDQLPERLRGLGRRHALVLRDETWEQDVDRLAAVLVEHAGATHAKGRHGTRLGSRRVPVAAWVIGATALAAVVLVSSILMRPGSGGDEGGSVLSPSTSVPAANAVATGAPGSAFAIDTPRNAEIAHSDLVFTLLTGSMVNRGTASTLWLRFRISNDGRYDVNLWPGYFRLATAAETLTPTSNFSEVLPAQSSTQKLVSFDIPTGTGTAQLRITANGTASDIPLDLRNSRRPASHEQPDTGDALSRARITTLVRDTQPLIASTDLSAAIVRITSRRFVNKQRITVALQYNNQGGYDRGSWDIKLRLVSGGDIIAPVYEPQRRHQALVDLFG